MRPAQLLSGLLTSNLWSFLCTCFGSYIARPRESCRVQWASLDHNCCPSDAVGSGLVRSQLFFRAWRPAKPPLEEGRFAAQGRVNNYLTDGQRQSHSHRRLCDQAQRGQECQRTKATKKAQGIRTESLLPCRASGPDRRTPISHPPVVGYRVAKCRARNCDGQLSNGSTEDRRAPVDVTEWAH
jgi:hypothetical protein